MEQFRIDNFERESAGKKFPPFSSASAQEVAAIRGLVARLVGLPPGIDGLTLVKNVELRSRLCGESNASEDDFDLAGVMTRVVGSDLSCNVFLNWSTFESLDKMSARDVAAFFEYIWYPGADDLDIIDEGGRWVVSIMHYGAVTVLQSHR